MIIHPQFDPVALQLGPLAIRWYALSYIVGFVLFMWLGRYRIKKGGTPFTVEMLDDFLTWGVLGVILGGRLGFVLFYQPEYYLAHPADIVKVWNGGMSFHGGFLGVLAASWLFARKNGLKWLQVLDFIAPLVPLGLASGRIGNFINGELWGRPTDVPWGMVFPGTHDGIPRHPSQLYEAGLEGIVLFLAIWFYSAKPRRSGQVSGLFLILYGVFRSLVELVRQPDGQVNFLIGEITMGQALSLPMILLGLWLMLRRGPRADVS